ncbi:hypothetical protein EYF80_003770 [Scomber scombrus]|uniref:Uncharacterized protein n=1 Tax=Scomber scombrus TaxID=13677 RepID=A0AAV1NNX9_SCOSC
MLSELLSNSQKGSESTCTGRQTVGCRFDEKEMKHKTFVKTQKRGKWLIKQDTLVSTAVLCRALSSSTPVPQFEDAGTLPDRSLQRN